MDCRYVRERLPAMMFDELESRERQVMAPHMGSCESCQLEQHAVKRVFMVAQTAVRSGGWVPDRFTETVISKLAPRKGRRLRHDPLNILLMRRMLRMAVSILAGISLVGLYVIFYDHLPHFGHGRDILGQHAIQKFHAPSFMEGRSASIAKKQ